MAFSQSLAFGENTLNELDNIVDVKEFETPPPCKRKYQTRQSKSNDTNNNNNRNAGSSGRKTLSTEKSPLGDVIEESPQDKTPTLTQLRQEHSTRSRKHLRKIKSNPINSISPSTRLPIKHLFSGKQTNKSNKMIDSPINSENKENITENDSFDKYMEHFQTQSTKVTPKPNISFSFKNCDFFDSKFSMEIDNANVSRIESMIKSDSFASEDLFASSQADLNEQIVLTSTQNDKSDSKHLDDNVNDIEWDESNFFDDFNTSLHINGVLKNETIKNETITVSAEVNALTENVNIDEIVENDEEVAVAVAEVNATRFHNQTINRTAAKERSFMVQPITSSRDLPSDGCDIRNLLRWGCNDLIVREYQKKGIKQMFQWQAECLANEKVKMNLCKITFYLINLNIFSGSK